jgi:hypothetical protein
LHFTGRSPPNPEPEKMFLDEITQIVNSEDQDLVLNCDETSWKLYPNEILSWADTGSQNVAISITENERDALTVIATVRLAGQKLPLSILAKVETSHSAATQLDDLGENTSDHFSSEWMTQQIMIRYLGWIWK